MAAIGTIALNSKRTIKSPTNPLDKATIVSIYPREINEVKHTIQPGFFHIPAGSEEKPSVLVVGPSSWWRDIGEEMPLIEIPNGAIQIADSFVKDFCNGLLMCDMDNSMPGLFFIPGELDLKTIKTNYSTAFNDAIRKQKNWFVNLVKLADAGWARTNGNPMAISDLMRMAAEALGQIDKDWMKSSVDSEKVKCVACGNLRNPAFPVCSICNRIVDIALATKLGLIDAPKVVVTK
jgi:hypothetical protein